MKRFWLLLLFCLIAWGTQAQSISVPALDFPIIELLARRIFLPAFGLSLLCYFVLTIIKLVLNYLLKRQIVAAATSESIVQRLLPGPQDEQNKIVKWVALLLSTGVGLTVSARFLPLGIHSISIMIFSTAFGFLAYYLFLRRQPK